MSLLKNISYICNITKPTRFAQYLVAAIPTVTLLSYGPIHGKNIGASQTRLSSTYPLGGLYCNALGEQ